jgi:hypothetical protein
LFSLAAGLRSVPAGWAKMSRWKLADATWEACSANCSNQAAACKRVRPARSACRATTFDNQAQSRLQGCQRK